MSTQNNYLNSLTFQGFSDNLNKTYNPLMETFPAEAEFLFIKEDVGERSETTIRRDETDMETYASVKPEGVDRTRINFGTGYFKSITAKRIGKQLNISYEMRMAPRFQNIVGDVIKRFTDSLPARMDLDRQHRLAFCNVSSYVDMNGYTVDVTSGDGQPLITTTHPLAFVSTTWSNSLTPAVNLSVTALDSMETMAANNSLDNYGIRVPVTLTDLIVNRNSAVDCRVAREILRSTTLVTQANPGVINVNAQKYNLRELSKIDTTASGFTDATKARCWFVASLEGANRFKAYEYIWENPHMMAPGGQNNGVDAYNDDWTWGASARYQHAVLSARGIFGSLV